MDPSTATTPPHPSWHYPRHAAFTFEAYAEGRRLDRVEFLREFHNEPETRTPRHYPSFVRPEVTA